VTRWYGRTAVVAAGAVLLGCGTIGPSSIPRDRFDYATAVGESWKEQTLLNVVKLRYLDVPIFLDVGQIVSGYTLETGVSLSGQVAPVGRGDTFGGVGGSGIFTERPTITYTPMTGDKFLRALISPIPIHAILYTLQSGYAADFILSWTVESLSGLQNLPTTAGPRRHADPAFVRALELMRELQNAGGVALGVSSDASADGTTLAIFRADDLPAETLAKSAELRRLLGLPTDRHRFQVVAAPHRGGPGELALQPRSLLQVLQAVGGFVDVPPDHLARQWAFPALEMTDEERRGFGIRIRNGARPPDHAYAAVRHQDHWFWIDQGDWRTKRTMALLILLFTLTDSSETGHLPVLTIPTS
jgi:hypothetical protein